MTTPTGITWKAVCDADFKAGEIVDIRIDFQNGHTHVKPLTIRSVDMSAPIVAVHDGVRLLHDGKVSP